MNKTAFFIVLLVSLFSLSACNGQAESETITDADIIDENLNLKNHIDELEMEQALKEQREEAEKKAESQLLAFFQQVISGNVEEAEKMVNSQMQVTDSALVVNDGSRVNLQNNQPLIMSFSDIAWESSDSICISVDLLNSDTLKNLRVHLVKVDEVWKIVKITN